MIIYLKIFNLYLTFKAMRACRRKSCYYRDVWKLLLKFDVVACFVVFKSNMHYYVLCTKEFIIHFECLLFMFRKNESLNYNGNIEFCCTVIDLREHSLIVTQS